MQLFFHGALMKACTLEEKERREDLHSGCGGNLNLGPIEWQPSFLKLHNATSTFALQNL